MTKTDIGIYRGLKEKFDPEVHVGFFITTDTGELLLGDQSLGQTISGWEINDGVLILKLNTGKDIRVTFPEATETVKGLLSAADKAQLSALQANLDSKVDKVTGKSLLADSEIEKLAGLPNSTELTNSIATAKAAGDNAQSDLNAHKQNTSNPHGVTKAQVGLGNVTNDAQVKRSEMGVANGVATLDVTGKIPISQIPSDFDDVIDVYATYTKSDTGSLSNITLYLDAAKTQLVTGEAGKLYQNVEQGQPSYQFKWAGTEFVQSGASSLIIGEVAGTAYDGAKGKTNADNIAKIKGTSLSHIKDAAPVTTAADKVSINYECFEGDQYGAAGTDHTADIPAATTAKAGVMSAADKTKLEDLNSKLVVADEEDVTAVEGKIKLKDRDTTNGMGYKILRLPENGILTQDMINQANTIYEIRYNFDLNGATITIPENCTLKFEGGSLHNGRLQGDAYNINNLKNTKIFEDVKFSGDSANTLIANILWFTDKAGTKFSKGDNIDCYQDLQQAINCGIKNIIVPSTHYFYISNTLVIDGYVNLMGDSDRKFSKVRDVVDNTDGCIFSDSVVTLLSYKYHKDNRLSDSLYLGAIKFVCIKPYTNLDDKEVPIVKIESAGTQIWGLECKATIVALDYKVDGYFVNNYTGLQIHSGNGPITYVKVSGYITGTYYGVINSIDKSNPSNWYTDFTLESDTNCVVGIYNKGSVASPTSVFGSHQTCLSLEGVQEEAYLIGEWINLYGFVWDIGSAKENRYAAKHSVVLNGTNKTGTTETSALERARRIGDMYIDMFVDPISVNKASRENMLNYFLYNKSNYKFITDISYTIGGDNVIGSNIVVNNHQLFGTLLSNAQAAHYYTTQQEVAYVEDYPQGTPINISFMIDSTKIHYRWRGVYKLYYKYDRDTLLKIYKKEGGSFTLYKELTIPRSSLYYLSSWAYISIPESGEWKFEFTTDIATTDNANVLPAIVAPEISKAYTELHGESSERPNLSGYAIGKSYFDTSLGRNVWWDGTKWVDPAEDSIKWRTIE